MDEYHEHREDCPFTFAPLDVCDCVQKNMAARIEHLEARVAAADKLADEMTRLMRRTPFVPAPNGIAVTITLDQIADQKAALAAYEATKEQSE